MYERSAIVLERFFDNLLEYRRECNLRDNYLNYCNLVEKLEKYQINYQKEVAANDEYVDVLSRIKKIQLDQKQLYKNSAKLEYDRNIIFTNIDEKVEEIEKCLEKIEEDVKVNNEAMTVTRDQLLGTLKEYNDKKFELSKCKRYKKMAENDYNEVYEMAKTNFEGISTTVVQNAKAFARYNNVDEIIETLAENGKNEKIPFNEEVIKSAATFGLEIAKIEAAAYLVIYDKMTKLLEDISNGTAKINLHKKYARNEKARIDFIMAVKDYMVQFLDYERMTVIHGRKSHNRLMSEACENFANDTQQMKNLFELLEKEIAKKATKKAYKDLYNKSYLTSIQDKEEKFKREKNRVNLNTATLVNSNYWRIDGIRNVYTIFYKNVTEVFGKDVAEFDLPKELRMESDEDEIDSDEYDDIEDTTIPFEIDGVEPEKEHSKAKSIQKYEEDDDEDDNNNSDEYEDEEDDEDDEDDEVEIEEYEEDDDDSDYEEYEEVEEDDDEYEEYDSASSLVNSAVEKTRLGTSIDEEFDIFGDKYKEVDFTETEVIAAKSKVEEEMKNESANNSLNSSGNVFKKISFEQEKDIPYQVEEKESLLFDDLKPAVKKSTKEKLDNSIENFDLIREDSAPKKKGMFAKFKKNSKKNFDSDENIW